MGFAIDTGSDFGKRALERVTTDTLAWLSTVDSRGRPQPNPVWFLWHDGQLVVYSEPNRPKLANIRRNPGVCLHLETIDAGNVVVFTGTAEIVDRASLPPGATEAYLQKYGNLIREGGWTLESMPAQYSETIRITPDRLRGF